MTVNDRAKPKYRKTEHPEGGWDFGYEGHRLRAVSRPLAEDKNARWAVYEKTGETEKFVSEGGKRDVAAWAAMDEIDLHTPDKPLLHAAHAAVYVKILSKAFPAAVAFEPVRDVHGVELGWTFWEHRGGSRYEFGWVSTDRRVSPSTVNDRHVAAALLKTAVRATAGTVVPAVVGAGGTAVDEPETAGDSADVQAAPEVIEGVIVGHAVPAKGCLPKDMEHPAVRAALGALGIDLPQYHPGKLRLAEMRDEYDPHEPDTYDPATAWGAWIVGNDNVGAESRIQAFWLEGGQYDRPSDPGLKVQLWILADRLSKHGFHIERQGGWCVTAWHRPGHEADELTNVWVVTGTAAEELTTVEANDYSTAVERAREFPGIKKIMRITGGIGMRRLSRKEMSDRGVDWAPVVLPPVRMVEGADGGSVPETAKSTYRKGEHVITQDGQRHTVWETVWRDFGGDETVEMIVSTGGREARVQDVAPAPAGALLAESDSLKGSTIDERSMVDAVTPLHKLCPEGHRDVIDAASALESYRTSGHEGVRAVVIEQAVTRAKWAAAKFSQTAGAGLLETHTWQQIVRYAVELVATRYHADRSHAMDPAAPYTSLFGAGLDPLEKVCPAGHHHVLNAARFWQRYLNDTSDVASRRRVDLLVMEGAEEFAKATGVGDAEDWQRAVLYLAETHAVTLVGGADGQNPTAGH